MQNCFNFASFIQNKNNVIFACFRRGLKENQWNNLADWRTGTRGFAGDGIQKHKPAMTDEEITRIRQELGRWPEWMRICFETAIYSGCRLAV